MKIDTGVTSYFPNFLGSGEPHPAGEGESSFAHHQEKIEGYKIRLRSKSFKDFFSQAALF
jgi:catalase